MKTEFGPTSQSILHGRSVTTCGKISILGYFDIGLFRYWVISQGPDFSCQKILAEGHLTCPLVAGVALNIAAGAFSMTGVATVLRNKSISASPFIPLMNSD